MTPAWAQRREEMVSDCLVSPDVFTQMVDRLGEFIVPYQQALETEAAHCILKWLSGHRSHQFRRQLRLHRFLLHWLVIVYHSCVALLQHHTLPRPLSSLIQVGCLQNGAVLVQLDRCTTVRDHRILSR